MDDSAGEACRYIELDVNIRQWNMFVRTSLSKLSPSIEGLDIEIGCCVEGRNDEEMPEQMLAGFFLKYLDPSQAVRFDHLLASYLGDERNYVQPLSGSLGQD